MGVVKKVEVEHGATALGLLRTPKPHPGLRTKLYIQQVHISSTSQSLDRDTTTSLITAKECHG